MAKLIMEVKSSKYNLGLMMMILFFAIIPSSFCLSNNYTSKHYGEALSKCLMYFEEQRSGHLPYNQRIAWRHHSALLDGLEQGVSNS